MIFAMEQGYLARYLADRDRAAGLNITEGQKKRAGPTRYRVDGREAILTVTGVLQNDPSFLDVLFGTAPSLTYEEIVEAIDQADADGGVDKIVLEIDSPGGYVAGVDMAALAVAAARKPTVARVSGLAASAAYWIASQAGSIEATSRLATFGSIGVARTIYKEPGVHEIASTLAPNKRPDVGSEEGLGAIRAELDAMHAIFAGDVARGRGVSVDKVNTDFGKGGTYLAAEALKAGMIDAVISQEPTKEKTAAVGSDSADEAKIKGRGKNMTLDQLKAEHPDLVTALVTEGAQAERKRVSDLRAFSGINADGDKAVEEAVASGKTYNEVAALLAAAVSRGKSAQADGENPPIVATKAQETGSGVGAKDELSDEEKALIKNLGITEEAYKAVREE
jgi:ClpP class serine protease